MDRLRYEQNCKLIKKNSIKKNSSLPINETQKGTPGLFSRAV